MENIIRKIEALLNVNGCTEAEAEARLAKAQELLERHNLDMANIGGKPESRKDQKRKGGLYTWQRNLWKAVAELNFCYYSAIRGLARGSSYEHRIIGSHANVIATEVMAKYLQETVERLAQDWAKANFYKSVFVREAIAYREGMTNRLSERLQARRDELVAEERQICEENEFRANSASTVLTEMCKDRLIERIAPGYYRRIKEVDIRDGQPKHRVEDPLEPVRLHNGLIDPHNTEKSK